MKIGELERVKLEFLNFQMGVLQEKVQPFINQQKKIQAEGNAIIQKFCTENKIDITKTDINLATGEVRMLPDKKIKKEK